MFAHILLPTLTEEIIVKFGNQMVLNKEFFSMMPVSMLIELPKTITDYLSELRQEWFVLFDRIAEYQHTDADIFEEVSEMRVWPERKQYIKSIYEKKSQVYRIHHLNEGDPQQVFLKPPPLPKSEASPKVASKPKFASSDEINSENFVKLGEEEFTQKAVVPEIKDSSPSKTLNDSEEEILASKTKISSSMALNDAVSPQFYE